MPCESLDARENLPKEGPRQVAFGQLIAGAVALGPVCADAQGRDAVWAQRQIIEAQCGTWARDQARDEYAPKLRDARQQLNSFSASRTSVAKTGVALAVKSEPCWIISTGMHSGLGAPPGAVA